MLNKSKLIKVYENNEFYAHVFEQLGYSLEEVKNNDRYANELISTLVDIDKNGFNYMIGGCSGFIYLRDTNKFYEENKNLIPDFWAEEQTAYDLARSWMDTESADYAFFEDSDLSVKIQNILWVLVVQVAESMVDLETEELI